LSKKSRLHTKPVSVLISKRAIKRNSVGKMVGPGVVTRNVHCADFIGRDQVFKSYGYTAKDVEFLIEKILSFLGSGAVFVPTNNTLRAENDGETLVFSPEAWQKLAVRRNERSYLLSLIVRRDYQIWATKFIPLAAQMDRNIVAGLDIPISFSEFRSSSQGESSEGLMTSVPLADITEAIAKHQAFVILGEPGAGKTTTLQKIAFEAATKLLSSSTGRVPLFVRLSQQGKLSPFDFLKSEWERHIGTDFADALGLGRLLLLADGINELPREDRGERLKAWRLFTSDYCVANQIVFTSRDRDYDLQLDLPRVLIEPMDTKRITEYLRRNEAIDLSSVLDDSKTSLGGMARNPFNLSLLVHAWKSNQREMKNRGRLLEWFIGELFAREERLAHPGWLRRDVQINALANLAFQMQMQGESTTFPLKIARIALPQTIEIDGCEEIPIKSVDIFRFARAATILDPSTAPDVRFYHHLIQEFFAALELRRRFEDGENLAGLWKSKRFSDEMPLANVSQWDPLPEPPSTGWEMTTILACGLMHDPAEFIEAVRLQNPVLAGRCIDEGGIARPETIVARVRADLLRDLYDPLVHLRARLQAGFLLGRVGDPRFEPKIIKGTKIILPEMVYVPSGNYVIGSTDENVDAHDNEKPLHTVELSSFEIGRWPVTNAEYACFIEANGYKDEQYWKTELARRWLRGENIAGGPLSYYMDFWKQARANKDWKTQFEVTGIYTPEQLKTLEYISGLDEEGLKQEISKLFANKSREQPQWWGDPDRNNPSQPVVGLTWFEAYAYCVWLSKVTGQMFRLPTEAEWEAAACGLTTSSPDIRVYPWGKEWIMGRANTLEGRVLKPSPVGAYCAGGGVGPFGTEDPSGNIWNWTSSLYQPYPYQKDDRENLEMEGERTLRGGSWAFSRDNARCARRDMDPPAYFDDVGLRLALTSKVPSS
jgi:formylglycine-generating enzyme required for sulfatase activity